MIGGVGGLILAVLGVKVFSVWAPEWLPRNLSVLVDSRVLLFAFGTCLLTGIAFGLVPAYRAVKGDVNEFLREGGRSTATVSSHRTRNALVVTEIALAFVLSSLRGVDDQHADANSADDTGIQCIASRDCGSSAHWAEVHGFVDRRCDRLQFHPSACGEFLSSSAGARPKYTGG